MSLLDALIEMSALPHPIHHLLFLALPAVCWCPKQMFSLPARQHAQTFLAFIYRPWPPGACYLPILLDGGRGRWGQRPGRLGMEARRTTRGGKLVSATQATQSTKAVIHR